MSNSTNSTLLDIGAIVGDLHYGPFASYWWYSKKDKFTNTVKLYPIRLYLKIHHIKKDTEFFTYITRGKNNKPEYCCYVEDINETSENMSTAVNNIYQKCLEKNNCLNNTNLAGPDYFGMGNEDHLKKISIDVTFTPFYIQENNFKMFVIDAS